MAREDETCFKVWSHDWKSCGHSSEPEVIIAIDQVVGKATEMIRIMTVAEQIATTRWLMIPAPSQKLLWKDRACMTGWSDPLGTEAQATKNRPAYWYTLYHQSVLHCKKEAKHKLLWALLYNDAKRDYQDKKKVGGQSQGGVVQVKEKIKKSKKVQVKKERMCISFPLFALRTPAFVCLSVFLCFCYIKILGPGPKSVLSEVLLHHFKSKQRLFLRWHVFGAIHNSNTSDDTGACFESFRKAMCRGSSGSMNQCVNAIAGC